MNVELTKEMKDLIYLILYTDCLDIIVEEAKKSKQFSKNEFLYMILELKKKLNEKLI